MKKKLLFIFLALSLLILPNIILGAVATIADIVNNVKNALNLALFGIVIISWIIVAVLFLMALGNPEKFNIAKKALIWTIIGTSLYALGTSIVTIIEESFFGV